MDSFSTVYDKLNSAQKTAVDAIEGPVLVVAGPGTGKTQLLSARVAQILRQTDVLPQNILCLTFTESGASNMRQRLGQFIGQNAYDVAIGTYHAFGGDLIRRFPEYFTDTRLERPVDDLGKRQLLADIIENLPYQNPLKQTRHHLGDLITTISELKRGLLSDTELRAIADCNLATIAQVSPSLATLLAPHRRRLPGKLTVAQPLFESILQALQATAAANPSPVARFTGLAQLAAERLEFALQECAELAKTTPLTKWKNAWLAKDDAGDYILGGQLEAERLQALAAVLQRYAAALAAEGLYDFDDMILRAINVLETNPALKYTLQEQYQYILLDEFQDTNTSQLRLVELLADNPVNEGRPNVLAVGDDDQAIYAFQGAQYSNMLSFFTMFRDVTMINLSENYRSTGPIVQTARRVADQIQDSLRHQFDNLDKQLLAANTKLPATVLQRREYRSEVAELAGIAAEIQQLIKDGVPAAEIAVLAPKHRYLEALVPYLHDIPVSYERRENILEAPVIRQLITMSRLVLALHNRQLSVADSLWPEVLSSDFWQFAVSDIWRLSWQASHQRQSWTELLLDSALFRPAALLFLSLAGQVETETLEVLLDRLIGTEAVDTHEADLAQVRSPLRSWLVEQQPAADLYQATTELVVLRSKLQAHQLQQGTTLFLGDLLRFIDAYQAADQQLLNTSPYNQAVDAVQLMTVYKAKGLEFAHVFLPSCQDDVWGNSARDNANKLTLPANLAPIRHTGSTEDERLRLFFVAVSRARYGLHLSSHAATYAGKQPAPLKYLAEQRGDDGPTLSLTLPDGYQAVDQDDSQPPALLALEAGWQQRHTTIDTSMRELLQDRLAHYQLSPTHLTSFIDLEHAGPQSFLLQTLLRFPSAPSVDIAFGNTMHETLEWLHQSYNQEQALPTSATIVNYFEDRLARQPLTSTQFALQLARGTHSLRAYLADPYTQFVTGSRPEYNFRNEGVMVNDAHLGGKIDVLIIDRAAKTTKIVDYKTGQLGKDPAKLHRYELQLYCYQLLVTGSHSFRDYQVTGGELIFVEPDGTGRIQRHRITFDAAESKRVQNLITAVYHCIKQLQLPDISGYGKSMAAIRQFEADLINGQE